MNLLISLLYAPIIFLSLNNFDITKVSLVVFILSFIWLIAVFKKGYKEMLFPFLYILVSVLAFFLEDFLVLKVMPLLISSFVALFILISYINKQSFILYFVKKFSKKQISKEEEDYIHKSTIFWFFTALINVVIHLVIFLNTNVEIWIYYSSLGWYFIFILAGVLQFLHKKFIFSRNLDV